MFGSPESEDRSIRLFEDKFSKEADALELNEEEAREYVHARMKDTFRVFFDIGSGTGPQPVKYNKNTDSEENLEERIENSNKFRLIKGGKYSEKADETYESKSSKPKYTVIIGGRHDESDKEGKPNKTKSAEAKAESETSERNEGEAPSDEAPAEAA